MTLRIGRWIQIGLFAALPVASAGIAFAQDEPAPPTGDVAPSGATDTEHNVPMNSDKMNPDKMNSDKTMDQKTMDQKNMDESNKGADSDKTMETTTTHKKTHTTTHKKSAPSMDSNDSDLNNTK